MLINDCNIKTVKEAVEKYRPCENWCAEFDSMDTPGPIVVCQFNYIFSNPLLLELPFYTVKNLNEELASCIVDEAEKTIAFKITNLSLLLHAAAEYGSASNDKLQ